MKASAYLRVSTESQLGEGRFGMETQREAIEKYAQANGITVVAWFADEGVSGASLQRPGLQSLIEQAGEGQFTAVIVAKMDRISRDLMGALWIEKELMKKARGVEIISVAEPFRGTDPANVLFRQIIAAFAQFEKSRIAERMSAGRVSKARTGGFAGGQAPIGYKTERGSKVLLVDPINAKTVMRLFALKDSHPGCTLQYLADTMNAEGWPTARGKQFQRGQVKKILDRRPVYEGVYKYGGVEAPGKHTALL